MRIEMIVSLKISDFKKCSKIIFKESGVLQNYFVCKLYHNRCRLYAVRFSYSLQTHSSTDYKSEIQANALALNLFTKHGKICNNQNVKQNKKILMKEKK
jgi:hypothetical protein